MKSWYESKTIWLAGWQQAVLTAEGAVNIFLPTQCWGRSAVRHAVRHLCWRDNYC